MRDELFRFGLGKLVVLTGLAFLSFGTTALASGAEKPGAVPSDSQPTEGVASGTEAAGRTMHLGSDLPKGQFQNWSQNALDQARVTCHSPGAWMAIYANGICVAACASGASNLNKKRAASIDDRILLQADAGDDHTQSGWSLTDYSNVVWSAGQNGRGQCVVAANLTSGIVVSYGINQGDAKYYTPCLDFVFATLKTLSSPGLREHETGRM